MPNVEELQKPEGIPQQLNFDDVFGTDYGFDKYVEPEEEQPETPSDFEVFVKMLNKSQFSRGFEERQGVIQMNEMGDCFDVNTKEIVLVEDSGVRTIAIFCASDESLLGFMTESVISQIRPRKYR